MRDHLQRCLIDTVVATYRAGFGTARTNARCVETVRALLDAILRVAKIHRPTAPRSVTPAEDSWIGGARERSSFGFPLPETGRWRRRAD